MRVKVLKLQLDVYVNGLKVDKLGRAVVCVVRNPLPDDARVLRVGYDYTGNLNLVIESATFDDLAEGDAIPDLPQPMFELIDREKVEAASADLRTK